MIYITGDTHRLTDTQKIVDFCGKNKINNTDVLIIAGDCAMIWTGDEKDQQVIDYYKKIWQGIICYIDGNHENHDLLNAMPVTEWNGGKVHQISDRVYHLMRGQVYQLVEGKKIFTMGGNESRDRDRRTEFVDWWMQERISDEDIKEAERNLEKHGNKVDIVITHCATVGALQALHAQTYNEKYYITATSIKLSVLLAPVEYSKLYTGHYHIDSVIDNVSFINNKIERVL